MSRTPHAPSSRRYRTLSSTRRKLSFRPRTASSRLGLESLEARCPPEHPCSAWYLYIRLDMGLQARTKGLHLGADAERSPCEQVSLCLQLHSHESQHCGNIMHIPSRWTALQVFMTPRSTWLGRSRIACSLWPSRWYCPFPLHVFRRLKDVAVSTHALLSVCLHSRSAQGCPPKLFGAALCTYSG